MRRALFLLMALAVALIALIAPRLPDRGPAPLPPLSGQVDRILVEKAARKMTVFRDGIALRSYPVALGFAPTGDKVRQGDGRTPEGIYRIDRRNKNSAFHLSLGINYPKPEDRARAKAGGYDPGGDIFIHGQPNAMPVGMKGRGDWTAGCIAVTNAQIEELWRVVPVGTEVEIRP